MLKNITLSAEEAKIQEARRLAVRDNTTLNQLFREWLDSYMTQRHNGTRSLPCPAKWNGCGNSIM